MPPAPPRFSTTIGCPSSSPARTMRMRVIVSGRPPAAYGTITLTGWLGNTCAAACIETTSPSAATRLFNGSSSRAKYTARMKGKLRLTLACWDYDRTRALMDGDVRPEGIELVYLAQPVEETFFLMMKFKEFDCSEMSLSSYTASLGQKNPPFIAIPVFPSRFFRHSCIFVSPQSG